MLAALATLALAGLSACQADTPSRTSSVSQAIVDGVEEKGHRAVVYVSQPGGKCTGVLIGKRIVLTAKHCVQDAFAEGPVPAADISVGFGSDATRPGEMDFYRAVDVVVDEGVYTENDKTGIEDLLGSDIALLTLQTAPDVDPLPVNFDSPVDRVGETATAVGFGQTPSSARGGIKMLVETEIRFVDAISLLVGSTICPGDSGGPLISDEGEVIGIVSLGIGETCGGGIGYYNRVDMHEALIAKTFEDAGEVPGFCTTTGTEICDGFDNDCNDEIDEGCLALGSACTADDQCIGANCGQTQAGRICTATCDPLSPTAACPSEMVCAGDDQCQGLCVPGQPGGLANGEPCTTADECQSLFCVDPGDGVQRCSSACRGGADGCFQSEACVASEGSCGSCADAELVASRLGFGEPCEDDARCRSGVCLADGDVRYCTIDCEDQEDCAAGSHCRDSQCVRGERATLGGRCVERGDCAPGHFCSASDGAGFCTRECESAEDCGEGFDCDEVSNGSACVPVLKVLGDKCSSDSECLTELCEGTFDRCSRTCSQNAACGTGFACSRLKGQAEGVCVAEAEGPSDDPPSDSSSCAVAGAGADGGHPWRAWAGLLGLLALVTRLAARRRSRAAAFGHG